MKKIYAIITLLAPIFVANSQVVISQVYGGGGNSGALYTHDFIELFNKGSQPALLTGHTLQYAPAASAFSASNVQTLPSITIPAGGYYLIQQAAGSTTTLPALPNPDLLTTTATNFVVLSLSSTNGKLALVNGTTPITSPTDASVVDFIGYGTANMYEGKAATGPLTNTTAAIRNNNGCDDTNDNSTNFTIATAIPRNSSTSVNLCATSSVVENDIKGLNIHPNPTKDFLTITSHSDQFKNVQIFNLTGVKVLEVTTKNQINVSSLKQGVYLAKIQEMGKFSSRKIIIK